MYKIELQETPPEILISELGYLDIFRSSIQEQSDIVFLPETEVETLPKCDIVFLLGGVSQKYRVLKAAECFHEGKVERIIATGGVGFFSTDRKETEAARMERDLIELGVPFQAIIKEDKSRNTFENIRNSIERLRGDFDDSNSINKAILTSDFHLRRASGMLEQQLGGEVFGIGAKDGKTDFDHWFTNPYGRDLIKKEAMLLLWYVKHNKVPNFTIQRPNKLVRKRR